jgi:transcriptional adapter 3
MAPPIPQKGAQKGTGKKGRDNIRQSRSRNSTPSLVTTQESGNTAYLSLPIQSFRACDDIVDHYGSSAIPSSKDLEALLERLQKLAEVVENRGLICDKGMRKLAQERKESLEEIEIQKRDNEQRERVKKDAADEEERGRNKANKIKKRKDLSTAREERPLTHGAHGLAPQDGTGLGEKSLNLAFPQRDNLHPLPSILFPHTTML